jgi:hypothetical protein
MRHQRTPTTKAQHDRNNELQYLMFKQQMPHAYQKLLATLDDEAREQMERTVARLEREEGGQQ